MSIILGLAYLVIFLEDSILRIIFGDSVKDIVRSIGTIDLILFVTYICCMKPFNRCLSKNRYIFKILFIAELAMIVILFVLILYWLSRRF